MLVVFRVESLPQFTQVFFTTNPAQVQVLLAGLKTAFRTLKKQVLDVVFRVAEVPQGTQFWLAKKPGHWQVLLLVSNNSLWT
jgi:hypothetical protein